MRSIAVALMAVSCVAWCKSAHALPQYDPQDPIDLNFGVLEALERVERACICHEGDGEADRRRTLRLLNDLDWRRDRAGNYPRLGDWARKGIDGGQRGFQFACARLFHLAGVLYGYPEHVATGRSLEAMFLAEGPETAFRDAAALPPPVRRYYELMSESHEDLDNEIRPGGRDGSPFWNGNALVFIYPPAFEFKRIAGAARYRFDVLDDRHAVRSFASEEPTASLKPVWQQIPVGFTTVECTALAADGSEIGVAGKRTFWRNAPFDPAQYAPAKRSYSEARTLALDYLFRWPDLKYLEEHGEPDVSKETNFTSYPSKMLSAVIHVMLRMAESFPDRRERALRIARISAVYLLRNRAPDSSPLAGFTPTYASKGQRADDFGGQHMLIYPAQAGSAFLALYAATKDGEMLSAARKIAQTYLRLQDKDGTWYLKMNEKDGSPVSGNRLVPTGVIAFLEELYAVTGEEEYRAAGDRAFAFIDRGPLTDWNWEGQFEDINPSSRKYQNLTKHNACETAIYLVKRFPGDRRRIAQARDILRYAEDQFVMWRSPCRSDGTGPWQPVYPFNSWRTPAVLEQYDCYSPIDASAAKLIRTYLALYRAEGRALDLAKARALGDSTVNNQDASGRIRTYWIPEAGDDDPLAGAIRLPYGGDWYNCMTADALALDQLMEIGEDKPQKTKGTADVPAKWISGSTADPEKPAPALLREFRLDAAPERAVFSVAVAGWCEVYVNGEKVGRDVLSPVVCQPDRRVSSLTFDVTTLLKSGDNTLEVLLGNGWQNSFTIDTWGFCNAPWKSCPKIRGELACDGRTLFVTDGSWRVYDSPIMLNSLRNGEWYDARREGQRINERPATVEQYVPWGCVSAEDAVPCRDGELFEPKGVSKTPYGHDLYDFGANISGWCEIEVEGETGAKVTLDYDEAVTGANWLLEEIKEYTRGRGEKRPVQHDEYTLAGRVGGERWHPRFTYHGFRYVAVKVQGDARVKSVRARFVHSGFARAGTLSTSDKTLAALQSATERSYLANFVGIPTDCPHREKNGWTGDAQLAMETGLWNFDAKDSYMHFLRMMVDAQRPNGAVPCILPCTPKFGFGWGSGPAWDAALFEIPWQIYRFYGDDMPAREAYAAMKRYLSFISAKADKDGLYEYGLGDWNNYQRQPSASVRFTDSAYVYQFNRRIAFWAERFGEMGYAKERNAAALGIKDAFNRTFYKGDGLYENGHLTALAAPLYFKGLCADGEEESVAKRLVETVRAKGHKAYFGILGAKWVPRVLAEYGYADDAFRLFVQPEEPGWANWLKSGDGTLRENWDGSGSHNHIMFGDLSAWAYECAAGIVPLEPGFRKVTFKPNVIKGVESLSVAHKTPLGEIRAGWKTVNGKPVFSYHVPEGIKVEFQK